jgi:hypothetical protein
VTAVTVRSQRATVQTTTKTVPLTPTWPSIPEPIDWPRTMSAAAIPPSTTGPAMSGKARSRLGRNLRSTGTSYAMSRPVSSAAIPPDALQSATTMPTTTAVSDADADRWLAE